MNVLGIEFSSALRSVAVLCGDARGKTTASAEAVETGGRAANTFALVDAALSEAGIEREQIDCIAVGLGPGSYTGIRAAISVAQGWELARGIRVLGISTTDCLAVEARSCGVRGPAALVIDAQRGEFYVAVYEITGAHPGAQGTSEVPNQIEPLRIVTGAVLQELRARGVEMFGPEPLKAVPDLRILPARALTLATLALGRTDFISAERLTPVYLREVAFVKAPKPRKL